MNEKSYYYCLINHCKPPNQDKPNKTTLYCKNAHEPRRVTEKRTIRTYDEAPSGCTKSTCGYYTIIQASMPKSAPASPANKKTTRTSRSKVSRSDCTHLSQTISRNYSIETKSASISCGQRSCGSLAKKLKIGNQDASDSKDIVIETGSPRNKIYYCVSPTVFRQEQIVRPDYFISDTKRPSIVKPKRNAGTHIDISTRQLHQEAPQSDVKISRECATEKVPPTKVNPVCFKHNCCVGTEKGLSKTQDDKPSRIRTKRHIVDDSQKTSIAVGEEEDSATRSVSEEPEAKEIARQSESVVQEDKTTSTSFIEDYERGGTTLADSDTQTQGDPTKPEDLEAQRSEDQQSAYSKTWGLKESSPEELRAKSIDKLSELSARLKQSVLLEKKPPIEETDETTSSGSQIEDAGRVYEARKPELAAQEEEGRRDSGTIKALEYKSSSFANAIRKATLNESSLELIQKPQKDGSVLSKDDKITTSSQEETSGTVSCSSCEMTEDDDDHQEDDQRPKERVEPIKAQEKPDKDDSVLGKDDKTATSSEEETSGTVSCSSCEMTEDDDHEEKSDITETGALEKRETLKSEEMKAIPKEAKAAYLVKPLSKAVEEPKKEASRSKEDDVLERSVPKEKRSSMGDDQQFHERVDSTSKPLPFKRSVGGRESALDEPSKDKSILSSGKPISSSERAEQIEKGSSFFKEPVDGQELSYARVKDEQRKSPRSQEKVDATKPSPKEEIKKSREETPLSREPVGVSSRVVSKEKRLSSSSSSFLGSQEIVGAAKPGESDHEPYLPKGSAALVYKDKTLLSPKSLRKISAIKSGQHEKIEETPKESRFDEQRKSLRSQEKVDATKPGTKEEMKKSREETYLSREPTGSREHPIYLEKPKENSLLSSYLKSQEKIRESDQEAYLPKDSADIGEIAPIYKDKSLLSPESQRRISAVKSGKFERIEEMPKESRFWREPIDAWSKNEERKSLESQEEVVDTITGESDHEAYFPKEPVGGRESATKTGKPRPLGKDEWRKYEKIEEMPKEAARSSTKPVDARESSYSRSKDDQRKRPESQQKVVGAKTGESDHEAYVSKDSAAPIYLDKSLLSPESQKRISAVKSGKYEKIEEMPKESRFSREPIDARESPYAWSKDEQAKRPESKDKVGTTKTRESDYEAYHSKEPVDGRESAISYDKPVYKDKLSPESQRKISAIKAGEPSYLEEAKWRKHEKMEEMPKESRFSREPIDARESSYAWSKDEQRRRPASQEKVFGAKTGESVHEAYRPTEPVGGRESAIKNGKPSSLEKADWRKHEKMEEMPKESRFSREPIDARESSYAWSKDEQRKSPESQTKIGESVYKAYPPKEPVDGRESAISYEKPVYKDKSLLSPESQKRISAVKSDKYEKIEEMPKESRFSKEPSDARELSYAWSKDGHRKRPESHETVVGAKTGESVHEAYLPQASAGSREITPVYKDKSLLLPESQKKISAIKTDTPLEKAEWREHEKIEEMPRELRFSRRLSDAKNEPETDDATKTSDAYLVKKPVDGRESVITYDKPVYKDKSLLSPGKPSALEEAEWREHEKVDEIPKKAAHSFRDEQTKTPGRQAKVEDAIRSRGIHDEAFLPKKHVVDKSVFKDTTLLSSQSPKNGSVIKTGQPSSSEKDDEGKQEKSGSKKSPEGQKKIDDAKASKIKEKGKNEDFLAKAPTLKECFPSFENQKKTHAKEIDKLRSLEETDETAKPKKVDPGGGATKKTVPQEKGQPRLARDVQIKGHKKVVPRKPGEHAKESVDARKKTFPKEPSRLGGDEQTKISGGKKVDAMKSGKLHSPEEHKEEKSKKIRRAAPPSKESLGGREEVDKTAPREKIISLSFLDREEKVEPIGSWKIIDATQKEEQEEEKGVKIGSAALFSKESVGAPKVLERTGPQKESVPLLPLGEDKLITSPGKHEQVDDTTIISKDRGRGFVSKRSKIRESQEKVDVSETGKSYHSGVNKPISKEKSFSSALDKDQQIPKTKDRMEPVASHTSEGIQKTAAKEDKFPKSPSTSYDWQDFASMSEDISAASVKGTGVVSKSTESALIGPGKSSGEFVFANNQQNVFPEFESEALIPEDATKAQSLAEERKIVLADLKTETPTSGSFIDVETRKDDGEDYLEESLAPVGESGTKTPGKKLKKSCSKQGKKKKCKSKKCPACCKKSKKSGEKSGCEKDVEEAEADGIYAEEDLKEMEQFEEEADGIYAEEDADYHEQFGEEADGIYAEEIDEDLGQFGEEADGIYAEQVAEDLEQSEEETEELQADIEKLEQPSVEENAIHFLQDQEEEMPAAALQERKIASDIDYTEEREIRKDAGEDYLEEPGLALTKIGDGVTKPRSEKLKESCSMHGKKKKCKSKKCPACCKKSGEKLGCAEDLKYSERKPDGSIIREMETPPSDQPQKEITKDGLPYCDPTNCPVLNAVYPKKWKTCCEEPTCPINDPTASTYKFLLKARMCCNQRGCQLAAKICDIYEPLVKLELEPDDVGNQKYHFLGEDAFTEFDLPAPGDRNVRIDDEVEENSFYTVREESDRPMMDAKESVFLEPDAEMPGRRERRASTVSWSADLQSLSHDMDFSRSAEEVVAAATAEANKFREAPQPIKPNSIFGDILKSKSEEPDVELSKTQFASQELQFKSQLDTVAPVDSRHKTKCCSGLRNKFKKKKKEKKTSLLDDEDYDSSPGWHNQRRHIGDPVEEKKERINKMLNNM